MQSAVAEDLKAAMERNLEDAGMVRTGPNSVMKPAVDKAKG